MENTQDDPYERALTDPGFLESVRAQHRGHWDVLDALWWSSHPNDAAPSGRAAPQAELRALQQRRFEADAGDASNPARAQDLRQLEADIARERTAIDAAVVSAYIGAGRALAGGHGPARQPEPPAAADALPRPAPPAQPAPPTEPGPPAEPGLFASRGRAWRRGAFAAAAVLVGIVIGGQLAEAVTPLRTADPPAPSPAEPLNASTVPALGVFDRTQVVTDTPGIPLPSSFDRSSVRKLASVMWDPSGPRPESPYYVARAGTDDICLLLMVDDGHYLSTCVGVDEFATAGVRLYWTSDLSFYADGQTPALGASNLYIDWSPNGDYEVGTAASDIAS
ncbi:hypothetical protein CTB96_19345 [Cryobacterium arcticum]|uniref:Uncharacterized protein n=1 Tax=Cryobacterium arcticum TaxID=670052 RepID=A0A317ZQH2_9MICO|nr:hypothetical protein CTB96_19345 [Cryobacterium arcticum]